MSPDKKCFGQFDYCGLPWYRTVLIASAKENSRRSGIQEAFEALGQQIPIQS